MERRMPQVTIVVTAYNKVKYLPECLASVRAQTFTDWECIVVIDGSPHVQVIRNLLADIEDDRFRILELSQRRGVSAARNMGILEARADRIICVDEDDKIRADCIGILLKELIENNADIVCPQGRFFGGTNRPRKARVPTVEEILEIMPLLPVGSLVLRSVFERIGYYDEQLRAREDHEWWIRVIQGQMKLHICNEELYFIRRPVSYTELIASLDFGSAKEEHILWEYITKKHAQLYERFPAQRRKVLRLAWVREADFYARCGSDWRVALCMWNAFRFSHAVKDLRGAFGAFVRLLFGKRFVAGLTGR